MISIPLKAFKGIKTEYLKELKFIYPKEKGGIAMNDIQLQKHRSYTLLATGVILI